MLRIVGKFLSLTLIGRKNFSQDNYTDRLYFIWFFILIIYLENKSPSMKGGKNFARISQCVPIYPSPRFTYCEHFVTFAFLSTSSFENL